MQASFSVPGQLIPNLGEITSDSQRTSEFGGYLRCLVLNANRKQKLSIFKVLPVNIVPCSLLTPTNGKLSFPSDLHSVIPEPKKVSLYSLALCLKSEI